MANENLFSSMFWMYFSYTLSFVIPLFCGLTLLTVKGPSDTKQAGIHPRYLLGIIFTLTGFLFIPNMIQDIYKYNTGISGLLTFDITVNLFLIPLYFFYFRKLTKPKKLKTWEASLHFLPAFIVFATGVIMLPAQSHNLHELSPLLDIFRTICLVIQVLLLTIYVICILKLKREHVSDLKENYSQVDGIDLRWINHAIPLAILYALIVLITSTVPTMWSHYIFHTSSIIFVFYLFIHALNEPYIHYSVQHHQETIVELPTKSIQDTVSNTPTSEISQVFPPLPEKYLKNLKGKREKMKDELVRLFDEKEIYTNGNLTINDVAALLGTNRTYISNVINNEFGFSFYQFVNKYRIQKASILFIEQPNLQIQEVASLVGFNSLSSFISSFKLNEGITPKQWKQRYVNPL